MPTSDPVLISPVIYKIIQVQPKTVLDIGMGMGKWGALVREYTEAWIGRRFTRDQWSTVLHGIEVYDAYRNPMWDLYNEIYIGPVQELLPLRGQYDLILMIDVLEHLEKETGKAVLEELRRHGKFSLVSYSNVDQQDVCPNKLEDHVSKWQLEDFLTVQGSPVVQGETWGLIEIPGISRLSNNP